MALREENSALHWAATRPEDNTPATAVAVGHFVQVGIPTGISIQPDSSRDTPFPESRRRRPARLYRQPGKLRRYCAGKDFWPLSLTPMGSAPSSPNALYSGRGRKVSA
jgi:hypothetical protein